MDDSVSTSSEGVSSVGLNTNALQTLLLHSLLWWLATRSDRDLTCKAYEYASEIRVELNPHVPVRVGAPTVYDTCVRYTARRGTYTSRSLRTMIRSPKQCSLRVTPVVCTRMMLIDDGYMYS